MTSDKDPERGDEVTTLASSSSRNPEPKKRATMDLCGQPGRLTKKSATRQKRAWAWAGLLVILFIAAAAIAVGLYAIYRESTVSGDDKMGSIVPLPSEEALERRGVATKEVMGAPTPAVLTARSCDTVMAYESTTTVRGFSKVHQQRDECVTSMKIHNRDTFSSGISRMPSHFSANNTAVVTATAITHPLPESSAQRPPIPISNVLSAEPASKQPRTTTRPPPSSSESGFSTSAPHHTSSPPSKTTAPPDKCNHSPEPTETPQSTNFFCATDKEHIHEPRLNGRAVANPPVKSAAPPRTMTNPLLNLLPGWIHEWFFSPCDCRTSQESEQNRRLADALAQALDIVRLQRELLDAQGRVIEEQRLGIAWVWGAGRNHSSADAERLGKLGGRSVDTE